MYLAHPAQSSTDFFCKFISPWHMTRVAQIFVLTMTYNTDKQPHKVTRDLGSVSHIGISSFYRSRKNFTPYKTTHHIIVFGGQFTGILLELVRNYLILEQNLE